jgi:phosphoribosylaminoimidazole-succinocarboxamide synthase
MLTAAGIESYPASLRGTARHAIIEGKRANNKFMNDSDVLFDSAIPGLPQIGRGKVRDIYSVDDDYLLIVTTDRLSAYDVVLPDPVPGKGRILTELSNFWFRMMEDLIPNHLTSVPLSSVIGDTQQAGALASRAIVVRRLKPLPIEAVVRGYLIGSGWRDYQETGAVCGIVLPQGLVQAAKLPETIFTPATKAAVGDHDINISHEEVEKLIGADLARKVRDISIRIYERAARYAQDRGIIIADTKFEFGQDAEGRLYLIDEVLTPDSSRFWPSAEYQTGISPPSFDKQFVRDYLDTLDWDKTAPGPTLPDDILQKTSEKYCEALRILTA